MAAFATGFTKFLAAKASGSHNATESTRTTGDEVNRESRML